MGLAYKIFRKLINIKVKYILGAKVVALCDYEKVSKSRCIIASNHISNFDPPVVGSFIPTPIHFLAKEELFKFRPFGWLISSFNAIPVKRGVVDKRAIKSVNEILNKDESILIFPEGSRKNFTAKPGIGLLALNSKSRILPVYVENSNHIFQCLFRIKRLKIVFGKPIEPSYYENLPLEKSSYRQFSNEILEIIKGLKNES